MKMTDGFLDQDAAAARFAALGAPQRLAVMQALVAAGPEGLSAGALAERVGLGGSTLHHHLRALVQSGLVEQWREGRNILSRARFEEIRVLSDYLLLNCCAEAPQSASHTEHAHD